MVANDEYERDLISKGYDSICGCDETAVGCLSGDVFCCALVFPKNINFRSLMPGLNDSKKKTPEKREILYEQIKKCCLDYAIGTASVAEIDEINIYWAKFLAFRRAIEKLTVVPDFILIDGDKEIPNSTTLNKKIGYFCLKDDYDEIPQEAVVEADGKIISVAAASIMAKVERDRYLADLFKKVHPDFRWDQNKGYYSQAHIDALKKHGKTIYHRDKYVRKFL